MRIVVLGLGNILLRDEGVGVRVIEALAARYVLPAVVEVVDGGTSGMELLDTLAGCDHLLVCDAVQTGDALIDFDADYIATHAKSLLTQIVIANSERVATFAPRSGQVSAGRDVILDLTLTGGSVEETTDMVKAITSEAIVIPNPTGLHARPAAVLANLAKKFKAEVRIQKGDQQANAKSVVAIMGLEIGHGDKVTLIAKGDDADAAIETLTPLLWEGLGDEGCTPAPAPASFEVSVNSAPAPRPLAAHPGAPGPPC